MPRATVYASSRQLASCNSSNPIVSGSPVIRQESGLSLRALSPSHSHAPCQELIDAPEVSDSACEAERGCGLSLFRIDGLAENSGTGTANYCVGSPILVASNIPNI
jgi:hypothetical protein